MSNDARQNRLRASVQRRGYRLEGSRALGASNPQRGLWRIVRTDEVTSITPFSLTLDDVERWVASRPGTRPPVRGRYATPEAVHIGVGRAPGSPDRMVLSASVGPTREAMADVLDLWTTAEDTVLDATAGNFAMWPAERRPAIAHDLALDGTDFRALPEESSSVDVVVFDPPYRPAHGGDRAHYGRAYQLGDSTAESVDDVLALYRDGLREAARVLCPAGRVIVKCQDISASGRLRLLHVDVLGLMDGAGFELGDMFVIVNTTRVPTRGVQQRARRAHSYLLVGVRR